MIDQPVGVLKPEQEPEKAPTLQEPQELPEIDGQLDLSGVFPDELPASRAANPSTQPVPDFLGAMGTGFAQQMTLGATKDPKKWAQALKDSKNLGMPALDIYENPDLASDLKLSRKAEEFATKYRKAADAIEQVGIDGNVLTQSQLDHIAKMQDRIDRPTSDERNPWENFTDMLAGAVGRQQQGSSAIDVMTAESVARNAEGGRLDASGASVLNERYAKERQRRAGMTPEQLQGLEPVPDDVVPTAEQLSQNAATSAVWRAKETEAIDELILNTNAVDLIPKEQFSESLQELQSSGMGGFEAALTAMADEPSSFLRFIGGMGVESLPTMLATAVNRGAGFMTGAQHEKGAALIELLSEQAGGQLTPSNVRAMLSDPEMVAEINRKATIRGIIVGAIDTGAQAIAGVPLGVGSGTTGIMTNIGAQTAVQGVAGAGGYALGQVATGDEIDTAEMTLEALGEAVFAAPEVAIESGRATFRKAMFGATRIRQQKQASQNQDGLVDVALNTELRTESPETYNAILAGQLKGSSQEMVWIPASSLQTLNQNNPTITELMDQVEGMPAAYADALARGGSVQIPNAAYLTYFADFHQELKKDIRQKPDGFSENDTAVWSEEEDARIEQMVENMKTNLSEGGLFFRDTVSELMSAGRSRTEAEAVAQLHTNVLGQLSSKMGVSYAEAARLFKLNIGREMPKTAVGRTVNDMTIMLDRLRAGDVPKVQDQFGMSLGEWVISKGGLDDAGGELDAIDADVGKVGKNRYAKAGGMSIDQAAREAVDAGYFPNTKPEDITPQMIIDAIDSEVAGKPKYSVAAGNEELQEVARGLNELSDYLGQSGIDLDQLTNEEVIAALTGGFTAGKDAGTEEKAAVRILNQFAGTTSLTKDGEMFAKAEQALAAGADAEAVRKLTGWFKGQDGMWRYEISDDGAVLKQDVVDSIGSKKRMERRINSLLAVDNGNGTVTVTLYPKKDPVKDPMGGDITVKDVPLDRIDSVFGLMLGERVKASMSEGSKKLTQGLHFTEVDSVPLTSVLDHPDLFAAYPQLANIRVSVDYGQKNGGFMSTTGNQIGITIGSGQQRSTLLHEIQHAIQSYENFASGGNAARADIYRWSMHKQVQALSELERKAKQDAAEAANELADAILERQTPEQRQALINTKIAARKIAQGGDPDVIAKEVVSGGWLDVDDDIYAMGISSIEMEQMKKLIDAQLNDSPRLTEMRQQLRAADTLSPYEVYHRLAGEVEARLTEARADMTPEQRKATAPAYEYSNNAVIVVRGDTVTMKDPIASDLMFRDWFDGSKVVDADGKPLVVYHGTARDFSAFKQDAQGDNFSDYEGAFPRDGFWFTSDPSNAFWYANVSANGLEGERAGGGQVTVPVYLSIQNPYIYSAEMFAEEGEAGIPSQSDLQAQGYDGLIVEITEDYDGSMPAEAQAMWDKYTPTLGAPISWPKELYDVYSDLLDEPPKVRHTHYVAFEPTQIKSIFNQGTWSKTDPRILNQSAVPKTTNSSDAETGKPMTVFFARNTVSSKGNVPSGMDFGQSLEPAGEYMVIQEEDMASQGGNGWTYGSITFNNPLVLEHKSTGSSGWKKDLSDMFGGKTGRSLTNAVKKAGFDGIVTRDKYGYSETVNIDGVKVDAPERNLMALHNLSAENLAFADKMGGIAVPSVAVVAKDSGGVDGFGEITLIGKKSIADPKREPVFSADAYTARFPKPVYGKVKSKPADKLTEDLRPFADDFGDVSIVYETYDNMVNSPDAQRVVDMWMRSGATMAMFLRSKGIDAKPIVKQRVTRTGLTPEQVESLRPLIVEASSAQSEGNYDDASVAKLNDAFADLIRDKYAGSRPERAEAIIKREFDHLVGRLEQDLYEVTRSGAEQVSVFETRDKLRKEISDKGLDLSFKTWVDDTVLPLYGEPKLEIGRRKVPYTLQNIVEAMTSGPVRGSEKTMTFGSGAARAATSFEFSDVEQMRRAAKESIVDPVDYEKAAAESEKLVSQYRETVSQYTKYRDWRGNADIFEAMDSSMRAIAKFSTKPKRDKAAMKAALKSEGFDVAKIPDSVIDQGIIAAEALLNAPVPYFEAKPQRAVSLSEFAGAVVPANLPDESRAILEKAGLPVIEYSGEAGRVEAVRKAAMQLDQEQGNVLFQDGGSNEVRGNIAFTERNAAGVREFQITLGRNSDPSTVLHELAHYYLEIITDIPAMAEDLKIIREWTGNDGGVWTTEQHEQFARGFEAYLREGKAPSVELAGAFSKFKAWLMRVYTTVAKLDVELNDEVRAFFDRMVASEAEIDYARAASGNEPMFESAEKAGMTPEEWAAYVGSVAQAKDTAEAQVFKEVAREEARKRSKWWAETKAAMVVRITEEIELQPVYQAQALLRSGPLKLNSTELRDMYGKGAVKRLAMMYSKNALPMDIVARQLNLGYTSADHLVKDLLAAPNKRELINSMADQQMAAQHGAMNDTEAADRAMDAVHNERQADVLVRELMSIARSVGVKNSTAKIAREVAKRTIARTKVRDLVPAEFQRAEQRSAREAYKALVAGDKGLALQHKQQQLLNFWLWKESLIARERADDIVQHMKKYNKKAVRQKLGKAGPIYLQQIDSVMEQYEFKKVSNRQLDRRASHEAWYNSQVAQGNDPYVPEYMMENMERVNYRELTSTQLDELKQFTDNVAHFAKLKNTLLSNQKIRNKEDAISELVATAIDNMKQKALPPIDPNSVGMGRKVIDWLKSGNSSLLKMEQLIDWLDGGEANGAWSTLIWQPLTKAQANRDRMTREVTEKILVAVDAWRAERNNQGAAVYIQEIDQSLTPNAMLAVALNVGNESNRSKLLRGHGWNEIQLNAILAQLKPEDWRLVKSLWETASSLWPQIVELEMQVNGIPPVKVEGIPLNTPIGTIMGDYWPLVYDFNSAEYTKLRADLGKLAPISDQGQIQATIPNGYTKKRSEGYAAPIMLDAGLIANHMNGVILDVTHRVAIKEARDLLSAPEVHNVLRSSLGDGGSKQMLGIIDGIANDLSGSTPSINWWSSLMQKMASNTAIAWMGMSVTTVLNQVSGYSQAVDYFMEKKQTRYFGKAMVQFVKDPISNRKRVMELSEEMAFRAQNLDVNMRQASQMMLDLPRGDAGDVIRIGNKHLKAIQKYMFVPLQLVQSMVDTPVWMAAYEAEGGINNHEEAVQAGDRAVRLSQMAGGAKDLAVVQQNAMMKLFLVVYSYSSLLWNRNVNLAKGAGSAKTAEEFGTLAIRFIMLNTFPALLAGLIKGQWPDDDEEESFLAYAAIQSLLSVSSGVPLVRDFTAGMASPFGYGGSTAVGQQFEDLIKVINSKTPETLSVATVSAMGSLFGLPSVQINRTLKTMMDEDIEAEVSLEFIQALLMGPPKK